jgi:hypothetical protein
MRNLLVYVLQSSTRAAGLLSALALLVLGGEMGRSWLEGEREECK